MGYIKGMLITPDNVKLGMGVAKWKGDRISIQGSVYSFDEDLVEINFPGVGTEYRGHDNIDIFEKLYEPFAPVEIKQIPAPKLKESKPLKEIPSKEYKGYKSGAYFKAKYKIKDITIHGKIEIDKSGHIYLCQNQISGYFPKNLHGYKYGWSIASGSDTDLDREGITDLFLSNSPFAIAAEASVYINRDLSHSDMNHMVSIILSGNTLEGMLVKDKNGDWYVLHNSITYNGSRPSSDVDTREYRYSWNIGNGSLSFLRRYKYDKLIIKGKAKSRITKATYKGVSFNHGDGFSAIYDGNKLIEGKINIQPDTGNVYLCQDYLNDCSSQIGFGYSGAIATSSGISSICRKEIPQPPTNRKLALYDFHINNFFKCKIRGMNVSGRYIIVGNKIKLLQNEYLTPLPGECGYKYTFPIDAITNQTKLASEGITDIYLSNIEFKTSVKEASKGSDFDIDNWPEDDYDDDFGDVDFEKEEDFSDSLLSEEELCEALLIDDSDKPSDVKCKKALTKQEISVPVKEPVTKKSTSDLLGCHGVTYSALYRGATITGKISVHAGEVYLCNSEGVGASSPAPLMFRFGFGLNVLEGTEDDLQIIGVSHLKVNIKIASHVKDPRLDIQIKTKAKKRIDLSVKTDHKQIF